MTHRAQTLLSLAALLALLFNAGCAGKPALSSTGQSANLTVLAAASLTGAFTEIGKQFEQRHPGARVTFNFAGSQQLAQQLANGAPADVFASANQTQMNKAIKSGRVGTDAARMFADNRLVIIFPASNPARIAALQDLADPGVKIVLPAKEVPAGQYANDYILKASTADFFGPSYRQGVEANIVSYEESVEAVVTKVSLGEADAGIAYLSDLVSAPQGSLGHIDIGDPLNMTAHYPIAPTLDSKHPELAKAFIDFVLSKEGQAILAKYGFLPAKE